MKQREARASSVLSPGPPSLHPEARSPRLPCPSAAGPGLPGTSPTLAQPCLAGRPGGVPECERWLWSLRRKGLGGAGALQGGGNPAGPHPAELLLAGSCLSLLSAAQQMTAPRDTGAPRARTEGGAGPGPASVWVWLLSGEVTVDVWNVAGQWKGGAQG